ncbi:MAG: hypothetical protein FJY67_10175 [Calditrichaeota bacterium]|nr:hypothetical protein [Calditrichota bacterium]
MSLRTNLSLAALVLLAVITLFAAPSEALAQARFIGVIDWQAQGNMANESVTIVVRTYDQWDVMVDEEEMEFIANQGFQSTWWADFTPSSSAVRWEAEIWPKSMFATDIIAGEGEINFEGDNFLVDPFVYGQ